jgi:hypothetical protein
MFVVVTVAGLFLGWIAWEWRFVRERHAARARAARVFTAAEYNPEREMTNLSEPHIPFWRTLMGDEAIWVITPATEQDRTQFRVIFPEAEVQ